MGSCRYYKLASFEDFQNWKRKLENRTNTRFVKGTGDKKISTFLDFYSQYVIKRRYYCTGGRKYVPLKTEKKCRNCRALTTRKIRTSCPAKIVVKCFRRGFVIVKYLGRHKDHRNEASHAFLRREQKKQIASKLPLGDNVVADQTRKEVGNDENLQLITKVDLDNTCKAFGRPLVSNCIDEVECAEESECIIGCIEEECAGNKHIEDNSADPIDVENFQKVILDACAQVINKYKDLTCLRMFRAGIKKIDAQIQISQHGKSSFSTSDMTIKSANKA